MKRSYHIEVDGELFEVKNAKEASDLLDSIVELAGEENVEIEIIEPPRITIKTAADKPTKSKQLLNKLDETQAKIREIYKKRAEKQKKEREVDQEISERMLSKIAREEDDNAIIALLL